ncbi:hypothetical protein [Pseudoxanthomonas sp. UTMC 1351]|uniref:hypothetical protein n=1 Tax=Pseudoxanthomonas sp. UTMC 1351 TaxID=2695853 RepID=UPI0034CD57DE
MMSLLSAVLAATLAAPLLLSLYVYVLIGPYDSKGALLLIMVVALVSSLAHVLLLGLPAFFLLRWRGWLKTRTIAAAGLLAGALPMAVITWPYPLSQRYSYSSSGMWHGRQVDFIADGLPTMFGWFRYLEGVATFGLLGVASALAFWFTWLYCRRGVAAPQSIRNFEAIGGFPDPQMK